MICNNILSKLPTKHVWVFLTDKCNLNCDYCFFRYRSGNTDLSRKQIDSLLMFLPKDKKCNLVISGGEPLLVWDNVRYIFDNVDKLFTKKIFTIQSNMYYWQDSHIKYVLDRHIEVEPGLDGYFSTNKQHRLGLDESGYNICLENVRKVVFKGIPIHPTMTVHPDEVYSMYDNFKYLINLGFYSWEVHPAFLMPWNRRESKIFLKEYKKILLWELKQNRKGDRKIYLNKMYSHPIKYSFDLIVQPNGKILPNWTLLSFPENIRERFVLFELTNDGCIANRQNLIWYLNKLKLFFSKYLNISYRDFSNFNAALAIKHMGKEIREGFEEYLWLTDKIKQMEIAVTDVLTQNCIAQILYRPSFDSASFKMWEQGK